MVQRELLVCQNESHEYIHLSQIYLVFLKSYLDRRLRFLFHVQANPSGENGRSCQLLNRHYYN